MKTNPTEQCWIVYQIVINRAHCIKSSFKIESDIFIV